MAQSDGKWKMIYTHHVDQAQVYRHLIRPVRTDIGRLHTGTVTKVTDKQEETGVMVGKLKLKTNTQIQSQKAGIPHTTQHHHQSIYLVHEAGENISQNVIHHFNVFEISDVQNTYSKHRTSIGLLTIQVMQV
ncbi:hypothetical protein ACOMHN_001809 [Nucella lapillus]